MDYSNKKVLVTGGSNGIGKEIAKTYKEKGAFVIVADKEESDFANDFFQVDFSDTSQTEKLMEELFKKVEDIDIIINNVGTGQKENLINTSTKDFLEVINTNLTSVFIISREFAKHRANKKEKWGRIVNIASTRYLMSEANTESYTASKGAIVSITHALAVTLSDYNVTVNCISPGWIENYNYDNLTKEDHEQHPSRRVGKPIDVAKACLYLTDEENDFINGQNIVVDGGMTKKMIYI